MKVNNSISFFKRGCLSTFFFIISFYNTAQINYEWVETFGIKDLYYQHENASSMIIDSSDNLIMIGSFKDSIDFDTSDIGENGQLLNDKKVSCFVTKFNPDGSLNWAKQIKGMWGDAPGFGDSIYLRVSSVSVDPTGNVYVTGEFNGLVDFNPSETETAFLTNPIPAFDASNSSVVSPWVTEIFILKLSSNGDFLWAKQLGRQNYVDYRMIRSGAIRVDRNFNVYVDGLIHGNGNSLKDANGDTHLIGDLGQDENGDIQGMFVLKLTEQGNFVWSKTFKYANPKSSENYAAYPALEVDPFGDILIGGSAISLDVGKTIDFDPGPGEMLQGRIEDLDGNRISVFSFVLKLTAAGEYVWVAINRGANENSVTSIATDKEGNVYYTGNFGRSIGGSNLFDANPDEVDTQFFESETSAWVHNYQNVYLIKLDRNRNFIYAKNMGGTSFVTSLDLELNSKNELYMLGYIGNNNSNFSSWYIDFEFDFDTTNSEVLFGEDGDDIGGLFVMKMDQFGEFAWQRSKFGFGPPLIGNAQLELTKSECYMYIGGSTGTPSDFDPGIGYSPIKIQGRSDIYLARYGYIFDRPVIASLGSLGFCPGDSVQLTSVDTLKNYLWSPGNETTKTIIVKNDGIYSMTTDYGCQQLTSDTLEVELFDVPQITTIDEITIKSGENVMLSSMVLGGDSYSWTPNDSTLSCIDCLSPIATPPTSTEYCITVMSVDSCVATECVKINVEPTCKDIFIPNAFSPNGDGNNDVLELQTKVDCITDFNLQIYDRWGEMVFEGLKVTDTWDGKFEEKELDNAVFVYQMKYKTIESTEYIAKKGNVSIIK